MNKPEPTSSAGRIPQRRVLVALTLVLLGTTLIRDAEGLDDLWSGTLEVVLAGGYNPANGTTLRLIDYGSRSGSFSTVTPPQGRTISENYQGDGLDVTIN